MSSTSRGAQRHPDDFYETPAWAVRAILRTIPWEADCKPRILEPMAGRGAIVRELRARWPLAHITACEIDSDRAALLEDAGADRVIVDDFLAYAGSPLAFDLALTNPAFSLAMESIAKCRRVAHQARLLLRLNFLGSQDRAPFWRSSPADVDLLPRRPSFAASLKCGKPKEQRCGYTVTLALDAPRPEVCPGCGGKVTVTTSDSCEYAWFSWGPGLGSRWSILELEQTERQSA